MPSHESRAGLSCSERLTLLFRAGATISAFRRWRRLLPGWFRSFRELARRVFWLFETSRRQTSGSSGWFGVRGCGAICAHLDFACLAPPPLVTFGRVPTRLRSHRVVPAFGSLVPCGAWV